MTNLERRDLNKAQVPRAEAGARQLGDSTFNKRTLPGYSSSFSRARIHLVVSGELDLEITNRVLSAVVQVPLHLLVSLAEVGVRGDLV